VRAAVRLYVLLHSGVGGFLVVSILTGFPPYAALVAWGLWHAKRSFRDAAEPSGGGELKLAPPLALQPYRRG
jgi:hypothetical protein